MVELQRRSRISVACAALVVLAVLLSMITGDALRAATTERAARLVDMIAHLGGLVSSSGEPTARPLDVRVVQNGGPLWITPAVESALEEHPAYALDDDASAIINVEVLADDTHLAVRGGLFRQGWNLGTEYPLRIRMLPCIPLLALALGWAVFWWRRRMALGAVTAAVVCVGLERVVGWPAEIPAVPWNAAVRDGPLGAAVLDLATRLPDSSVALGAGVVTLCMVLIAFDHRRSSGRGGTLMAMGLLGVLSLLIWAEVAARCGLLPWIGTPAGAGAAFSMALAWGLQARTLPPA